ncbi:MAG TPA: hypothetical protein HA252_02735 [Candidatus Diapherotrites archaeon]|uniref:Class III signal peptide-containing protein n=1 Tax=Candidatus Iainarchaeum sp. TaxID=3101447 RepID=A0A7J4JIX3_9ARCH|nr:hypothetical protein [Candidatus Diapherotrites archaeon]
MDFKGQGTTEYLIILAVVIVIALVVVGVLGFVPGIGFSTTEQQSAAYWRGASPFAVLEYDFDDTAYTFVLRNNTEQSLTLTEITLDGPTTAATALSVSDTVVGAGKTASVSGTYSTAGDDCTDLGDTKTFSYEASLTYNTANLTGKVQVGDRPLVGKCQN